MGCGLRDGELPAGRGAAGMQLAGTRLWERWTRPWRLQATTGALWGGVHVGPPHPTLLGSRLRFSPFCRCLSRAHGPLCTGPLGEPPAPAHKGPGPPPALCPLGCLPWGASLGSEEQTQPVLGPPASGSCPTPSGRGRSHQLAGPCPVSLTLLSSKDQGWVGLGGGPLPRVWASRSPPGAPVVGGEVGHTFFQGTHSAAGPPARPSISPPPQAQCGPHTESHSSLPEAPGDTAASLPGHAARRGWGRGEAGSC